MRRDSRVWSIIIVRAAAAAVALLPPATAPAAQDRPAEVRVNQAVYQLSFSGVRIPGQYQVTLLSPARAVSPAYDSNDNLLGSLHRIGGPVDVSGGWFDDGGGYEKFAYTASYADGLMQIAARALSNKQGPGWYPALGSEAAFGLQWITKLWNPARRVLYAQVGIGNGNAGNTIQGDYNFWFLPQQEDRLDVARGGNPGPTAYYVKYRPVFEAAPPGQPVSPDLAGRFAADFALGAQLAADPAQAAHLLSLARGVYAMAKTTGVGQLVTAFPRDYYPGSQWKSDMLWGAAEIALADEATGAPANFAGLSTVTGMRACSAGDFAPYNTKTAAYEDNVVAWPSVEPADDYTANSLLAFALGGSGLG